MATLSLFGYDPLQVYTGRAPLETAAMGIPLGPDDWAIRCNLVTVENEEMRDFTAGHITSEEGRRADRGAADEHWAARAPDGAGRLEFHPGVSYRNILVYRSDGPAPFADETKTQPPHDIPDQPIADYLPQGPGSDLLRRPDGAQPGGPGATIRSTRRAWRRASGRRRRSGSGARAGRRACGRSPRSTASSGAIISAVDLVRGVGVLLGWKRIDVPGATGYLDTDYAAKGRYGVAALADHDLVCVHVEAPDEASHEGKADAKVKALEEIDRHIVGPLLEALPTHGDWRILVSPDHRTPLRTRAHAHGAVPFAIAGTGIAAEGQPSYDEAVAAAADLAFEKGHELMRRFLAR